MFLLYRAPGLLTSRFGCLRFVSAFCRLPIALGGFVAQMMLRSCLTNADIDSRR
jgi:hypothetical protein